MNIDLNCDCAESIGDHQVGNDDQLIPLVTSVNLGCTGHGGDFQTITQAVRLARKHDVTIGAHPSYPDQAGFGRVALQMDYLDLRNELIRQIRYVQQICLREGAVLSHVKAHGALYNQAHQELTIAACVCEAILAVDPQLLCVGMPAGLLLAVAEEKGLATLREGFADRGYTDDGQLVSRSLPNALITDPEDVALQALRMIREHRIISVNGREIAASVDTLCLHGDGAQAVSFAHQLRKDLIDGGITIQRYNKKS